MYKPKKSIISWIMLLGLVFLNFIILFVTRYLVSYTLLIIIRSLLIIFNIYELYYITSSLTLSYIVQENSIIITTFNGLRKVVIPFSEIICYKKIDEIEGVKLSGISFKELTMGRCYIENLGTTRMYTTSKYEVIYLITKGINYAITPMKISSLEKVLKSCNIPIIYEKINKPKEKISFHKDKIFIIPFILTSFFSFTMILVPFILYLRNKLPYTMPLSFDTNFNPSKIGTGKQFAFQQMMYGALNLALLFCMYFASFINAKYDKKSAYKYMYIALMVSMIFILLQNKILNLYL